MALLMIEGFDNYTSATDIPSGNKASFIDTGSTLQTGRSGSGQALARPSSGNALVIYPVPEVSTLILGFAVKMAGLPSVTSRPFIVFRYGGVIQASVYVTPTGYFEIRKGTSTTGQVVSTIPFSISVWQYVEAKLVVHDSTGSLELKMDGVSLGTVSGDTDLANTAGDLVNNITLYTFTSAGVGVTYDDLYICDTTGSINNDFLGDCVVETLRPDGAGANTNWTPAAGANYAAVDETLEDGDTTYISSSTATDKDTYTFAAIASANTDVRGVGVTVVAERKDGGERALTTETIDGANLQTGANMYVGGGQYGHYQTVHETYDGTNQWTVAKVDGGEFGVTVSV